jgi:hypothetical protein
MLERKQSKVLYYVEDYLESLLYLLKNKEKTEVEAKIEEEKEESLKIRITSITQDGKKTEVVSEVPRPSLKRFPILIPINVIRPLELTKPILLLQNEVFVNIKLPSLNKVKYFLQTLVRVSDYRIKVLPLCLPFVLPKFYSWLREENKSISFIEQQKVVALTSKNSLRLIEISPKLPRTFEYIGVSTKLPILIPCIFFIQNEIKAKLTDATEVLYNIAKVQELKGKGLLELLFPEEMEKFKYFHGALGGYLGEPIIIILPESKDQLWYLFWVICRELYREIRGSYPEPVILLNKGDDLWLRLSGAFSGKIVVLYEENVKEGEKKEWFRRRLQESFSQGLGFLIIIAKEVNRATTFIKELCKPYVPMIVDIHAVVELDHIKEALAKILSTVFGIPYNELRLLPQQNQLDIMIAKVDRIYRNFISELLLSNYLAYVRRDISEQESEEHIAMKILAIKHASEKFNIKPEGIACTFRIGNEVITDVYIEEKALVIECETMFGTAPSPLLKIFESVRKYIEREISKPINEIWMVIRNWSAILHLGDLLWAENTLREEFKRKGKDIKIKFFIPDIYGKTLKPIDNVVNTIKFK